jgi:hypothetical protein
MSFTYLVWGASALNLAAIIWGLRAAIQSTAMAKRIERTAKHVRVDVTYADGAPLHLEFDPKPGSAAAVEAGVRRIEMAEPS